MVALDPSRVTTYLAPVAVTAASASASSKIRTAGASRRLRILFTTLCIRLHGGYAHLYIEPARCVWHIVQPIIHRTVFPRRQGLPLR